MVAAPPVGVVEGAGVDEPAGAAERELVAETLFVSNVLLTTLELKKTYEGVGALDAPEVEGTAGEGAAAPLVEAMGEAVETGATDSSVVAEVGTTSSTCEEGAASIGAASSVEVAAVWSLPSVEVAAGCSLPSVEVASPVGATPEASALSQSCESWPERAAPRPASKAPASMAQVMHDSTSAHLEGCNVSAVPTSGPNARRQVHLMFMACPVFSATTSATGS
jgi:hypothetical protein